jgi:hypothetical protein
MINALYFQQRMILYALPSILLLLEAANAIFDRCCEDLVSTGRSIYLLKDITTLK